MPTYQYEAMYQSGEKVVGVVEASSQSAAVSQVRKSCEVVLSMSEVRTTTDPLQRFRKIDLKSLTMACRQFSILLKAGLPLMQTVDLVAGQTRDRTLRKLLHQVSEDVSNGWSLSFSLEQRGEGKLPTTLIETVRSGEESGNLTHAFERLSVYYDRLQKTSSKVASAMIYPVFVLAAAVVVVGIIMVKAVPTLSKTFTSMGIDLPLVTRAMIAASNFMTKYILLIIGVIAGLLILFKLYQRSEKGGMQLARMQMGLPVLGKIALMSAASQFSHTMSTMLGAGMSLLQSLDVTARSMDNMCLAKAVRDIIPGVEAGGSVGQCMAQSKDLPEMLVQMTAVGEATGSLESTLDVLGEYYDNEVDTLTARAMSLLEPIIVCLLAGVVILILMAIYLPMFTMYNAI
jgi:type IV pilus assembly protein PilC